VHVYLCVRARARARVIAKSYCTQARGLKRKAAAVLEDKTELPYGLGYSNTHIYRITHLNCT